MARSVAWFASIILVTSISGFGQSRSNGLSEPRLVYPVNVNLQNRAWLTLQAIRLQVFAKDKGLFDGLKLRLFQGSKKSLASRASNSECTSYDSLYFMPTIRDQDRHPRVSKELGSTGFWAVLDLGVAANNGWIEPGLPNESYVVVFEQSKSETSINGQKWQRQSVLLKSKDTYRYFNDFGVAISLIRNVTRSGFQGLAYAASSGVNSVPPDEECRELKPVNGMLFISKGPVCQPASPLVIAPNVSGN